MSYCKSFPSNALNSKIHYSREVQFTVSNYHCIRFGELSSVGLLAVSERQSQRVVAGCCPDISALRKAKYFEAGVHCTSFKLG